MARSTLFCAVAWLLLFVNIQALTNGEATKVQQHSDLAKVQQVPRGATDITSSVETAALLWHKTSPKHRVEYYKYKDAASSKTYALKYDGTADSQYDIEGPADDDQYPDSKTHDSKHSKGKHGSKSNHSKSKHADDDSDDKYSDSKYGSGSKHSRTKHSKGSHSKTKHTPGNFHTKKQMDSEYNDSKDTTPPLRDDSYDKKDDSYGNKDDYKKSEEQESQL